ncbi:conserved hypothetical protein [Tenacibaculum sp. 190524A05c]|uniref:M43 family zinc metalloprotease n=1 Tax=Tenacibaculum platacis TaxID=3137852 RepID=UPI0031FB3495
MVKDIISLSVKLTFKKLSRYFSKLVFIQYLCDKNNEKSVTNWILYKLLFRNTKQNLFHNQIDSHVLGFLILSFLISLVSQGQELKSNNYQHHIEQTPTAHNIALYKEFIKTKGNKRYSDLNLPIILHIVRKSNGTTDYDLSQFISTIPNGFVTINKTSSPLNIRFYLAKINYIDSDYLYAKEAKRQDYVNFLNPNCTNFFITNKGGSFSSFPNSSTTPNAVFFSKNMFGSPAKHVNSNLSHEIGHYLGLFHTHTSTEYGNSYALAENVAREGDQSNCSSTGDYLCSTPADPHNSKDTTDKYGSLYIADKSNFMSYYSDHRNSFTNEQLKIMRNALEYRLNDDRYDLDGYQSQELIQAPKITHIESTSLYNSLKWTNIESNLGYIVERANKNLGNDFEPIAGISRNKTIYIDKNISANTQYTYRVIPLNSPKSYSDAETISTTSVYCNTKNTCEGFGFVPERITLTNKKATLIDINDIDCSNSTSVINSSDAIIKSNSELTLTIAQSRKQDFYYNVFIDLNGDGLFNDKEEWIIKNTISTNKYSFSSKFNLGLIPVKQGQTSMRIICSLYQNTNGKYPIKDACNVNLGFTQDFTITLLDQSKEVFWVGNTNQDWFTPSNWSNNSVPNSSANIIIPDELKQYPIINDRVNFNTLKVESGASLISTIPIEGAITYEKKLKNNKWNLISSPLLNQTVDKLIKNNKLIVNSKEEISLSYFDTMSNTWNCFMNNAENDLEVGKGYSIKLNDSKTVTISGKLATEDISIPIITGNTTKMNLIGNPYLAYTYSEKLLNSNSFNLSENTIWTWNGEFYQAHNNMNPIEIEPGQGFFVEAKKNGNITFLASDAHHKTQNTDNKPNNFTIKLSLENSMKKRSTTIYYSRGKSIDFDNGYDSKIFTEDMDLLIYSELISKRESRKLAIQTLPDSNYNEMILPIGFKTTTRQELTLSAELLNLPDDVDVILEDRTYNKFINLKNDTYVFSPTKNSIETGRFYIHTKQTIKDETDNSIDSFQIFKSNTDEITIKNLRLNGLIQVYSIQGKVILDSSFESSETNRIKFNQPASGIYLVAISTEEGKIIKKMKL